MTNEDKLDLIARLHSKFRLYTECGHDEMEDQAEHHEGRVPVHVEDIGNTCAEPRIVCHECHLEGEDPTEFTDDYEWPCDTMKIVKWAADA